MLDLQPQTLKGYDEKGHVNAVRIGSCKDVLLRTI